MKKFVLDHASPQRLVVLAILMTALWFLGVLPPLSREERRLAEQVRAAQNVLWNRLGEMNVERSPEDLEETGFIGIEWSPVTTTLGSLEAKRCACDPLWGVQMLRWLDGLGLQEGDRVLVMSSSSFPGMLYSVLAACEARAVGVDLVVSLGSSTWGANRSDATWPVLGGLLRAGGFLSSKASLYTMGGDDENGRDISPEGREILTRAAAADGVELFVSDSLQAIIDRKLTLMNEHTKLVVSIGGSEANMGRDTIATKLAPGLLRPSARAQAGDGAIALALERGVPVLHILNLRRLAGDVGIDFDTRRAGFRGNSAMAAAIGLAVFCFVLVTHRRWTWESDTQAVHAKE